MISLQAEKKIESNAQNAEQVKQLETLVSPSAFKQMLQLWQHKNLLFLMVSRDIVSRHKGSLLGRLWPLLHPLGQLIIYTFVFSEVLKVKFGTSVDSASFALYFMTGLIPWSIFAESVSRASTVILENPNLVTKVVFPTEILPLVNVFSASATQFFAFLILFVSAIFYAGNIHASVILLPVIFLPLILFSAGISCMLAAIGVYVRDTRHMVSLVLQAGMYATPILYPLSSVPEKYRFFLVLNPLSGIIDDARKVLLEGLMPDWTRFCGYTLASLIVCSIGLYFFLSTKDSFADVM